MLLKPSNLELSAWNLKLQGQKPESLDPWHLKIRSLDNRTGNKSDEADDRFNNNSIDIMKKFSRTVLLL